MKLVVFVLRGCSVNWLGAYGNEWVVTPDLDRLAAEGVVFDRHYSDVPSGYAFRAAWQTGRDQFRPYAARAVLLPTLRAAGVFTAIVRANRLSHDAPADYYAAWDKVFDARPTPGEADLPLAEVLPDVLDELAAHADWLLWVELDTLLPPWEVPPAVFEAYIEDLLDDTGDEPPTPWAAPVEGWFDTEDVAAWELLHTSFAAVVTKLDADLGQVFAPLMAAGAGLVVTSNAGFPLGEHGVIGAHRPWLHEEMVHLPLLVRLPDAAHAGLRVNAFTQPADLMPTLLGLFGQPPPPDVDGHDLSRYWHGPGEPARAHAVSVLNHNGAIEKAIRTDDWAYLLPVQQPAEDADEPRTALLFVKPDDRREVNDVAARQPDVADRLAAELKTLTSPR